MCARLAQAVLDLTDDLMTSLHGFEATSLQSSGARAAPLTSTKAQPRTARTNTAVLGHTIPGPSLQQPDAQPQLALCGHPDALRRREQAMRRCVPSTVSHSATYRASPQQPRSLAHLEAVYRKATATLDAQLARSKDW